MFISRTRYYQIFYFLILHQIAIAWGSDANQHYKIIETEPKDILIENDFPKLFDNDYQTVNLNQTVKGSEQLLKLKQFINYQSNLAIKSDNETTSWKRYENFENFADDNENYDEDYEDDDDDSQSFSNRTTKAACDCKCGLRNVRRIVGGTRANKWEFPWQLALVYRGQPICGASLISDRHAITAAHCTVNLPISLSQVKIAFKLWNQMKPFLSKTVYRKILSVHRDGYQASKNNRDIAILKFKRVSLSKRLSPICLPKPHTVYDNILGSVSGWGTLKSKGKQPTYLQFVKVRFLSNKECAAKFAGTGIKITKYMVCAGSPGKDSCQGDSGGPLIIIQQGRHRLAGAVSFGIGCGGRTPGVYTRINQFLPFIKNLIKGDCKCEGNIYA